MVRRGTDRAIYYRIAILMRARIIAGEFPLGERLPTEKVLAQEYDVGVWTIGAAIAELRVWGYVMPSQPGQSARVAEQIAERLVSAKRGSRVYGDIATEEQAATVQARAAGVEAGMLIQVVDFFGQIEVYPYLGTVVTIN